MICAHNRRLKSTCIDCDPVTFFEKKLTEALEGDPDRLRDVVARWRDYARQTIAERD